MLDQYEIQSQIGKGSFGIVYKVARKIDQRQMACKELNYGSMSEKEKEQLVNEVNILRDLNHQNIVKYYERIIDKKAQKIYIFTEYCSGGDLSQLLKKCKKAQDFIAEDVIWKIFTQLCQAINEIHNRQPKVLHRDIKPANIFLDQSNHLKLGDFGLARILGENSQFCQTYVGTPYYMSPEQINDAHYDEKSDIWSCGCLLYELAALKPPFEASNHLSLALKIKTGVVERIPLRYSEDLQNLISSMLNLEPSKRPSIQQQFTIPQIALRIKEIKLNERHNWIKLREEELRIKEQELLATLAKYS